MSERKPQSGDRCRMPGCGGKLKTYSTRVVADVRVRYLECDECGYKPLGNKLIIPLRFAPPRRRRAS